jgi:hypothetical protein
VKLRSRQSRGKPASRRRTLASKGIRTGGHLRREGLKPMKDHDRGNHRVEGSCVHHPVIIYTCHTLIRGA